MKKPKPYNGGQWTSARLRAFIMSALRGARWGVKYEAIRRAYVKDGINKATGRKCKLHECAECHGLFPAKEMQADHIDPVVPVDGEWDGDDRFLGYNWNQLLQRLFCEADGFQALCKGCHKAKCDEERKQRAEFKRKKSSQGDLFN